MTVSIDDLKATRLPDTPRGIESIELTGPPSMVGTVCRIDLRHYEFRVFCFKDLIDQSLHPEPAVSLNLGCSIPSFIRDHPRCVIASNTLQTNFISSKGFVIEEGQVIAKPLHALGRGDPEYATLGVAGDYTCLLVDSSKVSVISICVDDAVGSKTAPVLPPGCVGIASPRLVEQTAQGPRVVEIAHRAEPFRDGPARRLNGDCVDWDPESTATSFTSFGVAANDQGDDTILVMASIFAGEWGVHTDDSAGVHPAVMGQVMIRHGKCHGAILGGGSADTQQFIRWRNPQIRVGPVRTKSPAMSRGEVSGIRGLGAIAAILSKT